MVNWSIGEVHLAQNESSLAYSHYQTALKQAQKAYPTQKHRKLAQIYSSLGHYHLQNKNPQKALDHYQKGLMALFPTFQEEDIEVNPKEELFYTEPWIMEMFAHKAHAFYQKYREQSQEIGDLQQALQCSELAFKVVRLLHRSYDRDASKHLISNFIHESYETAIAISLELHKRTQKPMYLEKAFAFTEQSKASALREAIKDLEAKQFAAIPAQLLQREKDLKIELAYFEKQFYEAQLKGEEAEMAAISDSLFVYRNHLNQLIQQLERAYPKYFQLKYDDSTVSFKTIQERISTEHAVMEYFVGDTLIYCFVIEKANITKHILPIDTNFTTLVEQFRASVRADELRSESDRQTFVQTAHQLYLNLLKQPLEGLKNKKINSLTIVPDGILGYIPFDVLLYEPIITYEDLHLTQPYVLQKYTIGYTYASSMVFEENPSPKPLSTYSFGGFGPIYTPADLAKLNQMDSISNDTILLAHNKRDESLNDLEAARKTLAHLADFLNGDKWLAQAASEKNFKAHAANYGILHLAMHGVLNNKNPLYSHLIFTLTSDTLNEDNLLTAAEIYNLQLNAGLAVLSACDTGTGELKRGEGIMSLARAFAYAGCPSMVMSLWSVPDGETGELMEYFYEELKTGISKDEALRQAKLRYLEAHKTVRALSHPYHWAAFVPIGDMEAMEIGAWSMQWWMWLLIVTIVLAAVLLTLQSTKKLPNLAD